MKLAFVLFNYFPSGGLTRDACAIAQTCRARGHEVLMIARERRDAPPLESSLESSNESSHTSPNTPSHDFTLRLLPNRARHNHAKDRQFADEWRAVAHDFGAQLCIGFNKMPGLDLYYAADGCFAHKITVRHRVLHRLLAHLPRYRAYLAMERAVFAGDFGAQILLIAANQRRHFQRWYATPDARFTALPPGIDRARIAGADALARRAAFRREWQLTDSDTVMLAVGSGFRTKGVSRSLRALASLPPSLRAQAHLFVVGADKLPQWRRRARRLGLGERVIFTGARDDVDAFMLGADVLAHPAVSENTGTVLLESMVAGLPIVATDVCGYAHYIADEHFGAVVAAPFKQREFNRAVVRVLQSDRDSWRHRARDFAARADIYDMTQHACDCIEHIGAQRR